VIEYFKKGGIGKKEPSLIELLFLIFNQASWCLKVKHPADIFNQAGEIIFQGKRNGKRQTGRILSHSFKIIYLSNAIDII